MALPKSIEVTITRITCVKATEFSLLPENLTVEFVEAFATDMVRDIYKLATLEECIAEYPSDWWQAFKERWFPKWLRQRYPIKHAFAIAVHKFPEYQFQFGKEYVHILTRIKEQDND